MVVALQKTSPSSIAMLLVVAIWRWSVHYSLKRFNGIHALSMVAARVGPGPRLALKIAAVEHALESCEMPLDRDVNTILPLAWLSSIIENKVRQTFAFLTEVSLDSSSRKSCATRNLNRCLLILFEPLGRDTKPFLKISRFAILLSSYSVAAAIFRGFLIAQFLSLIRPRSSLLC